MTKACTHCGYTDDRFCMCVGSYKPLPPGVSFNPNIKRASINGTPVVSGPVNYAELKKIFDKIEYAMGHKDIQIFNENMIALHKIMSEVMK